MNLHKWILKISTRLQQTESIARTDDRSATNRNGENERKEEKTELNVILEKNSF